MERVWNCVNSVSTVTGRGVRNKNHSCRACREVFVDEGGAADPRCREDMEAQLAIRTLPTVSELPSPVSRSRSVTSGRIFEELQL